MSATLRASLIGSIFVLALLWRLPITPDEWRFTLCENDSLFHLHRADLCLGDFPQVRSIDPFSHHPEGYRIPWRAPLSAAYAAIGKLAGVGVGELNALMRTLAPIPPALGLLSLWVTMRIAADLGFRTAGVLIVGFTVALSLGVSRPFFYGVIDHHSYTHLSVLLLLAAHLRRSLLLWALGHGLLALATPEGPFYSAIALGAFAASELIARRVHAPVKLVQMWLLVPAGAAALALGFSYALETNPLPLSAGTWIYLSWVHILVLAFLGVAAAAILVPSRSTIATCIFLAVFLGLLATRVSFGDDQTVLELLFRPSDRLYVNEEHALLRPGWSWDFPWYFLLFAAGILHAARFGYAFLRGSGEPQDRALAWFAVAGTLGLTEFRHYFVLNSVQILSLGAALRFLGAAAERRMGARRSRLFEGIALAAIAALFLPPHVLDPRRLHGDMCEQLRTIDGALAWLREQPGGGDEGVPATGAVYAPWYVGHQFHVLGRHPVIVDPFNFAIEDRLRSVWWAESTNDLVGALERIGARFFVLMEPARNIFALPTPKETSDLRIPAAPNEGTRLSGDLLRFATFRHYVSGGFSEENARLRPRFLSREKETIKTISPDGRTTSFVVPRVVVLEVKPGATIEGEIPSDATEVHLDFHVRLPEREKPIPFRQSVSGQPGARFTFRTATPAPIEETTFRIDEGYCVSAGSHAARIDLTPAAIDRGEVIRIDWQDGQAGGAPCVATPKSR